MYYKTMTENDIIFREMTRGDWTDVAEIYGQGIRTGNATFQQEIPAWDEWNNGHLKKCRIVAVQKNDIVGWAALSPVSGRCVYAGVAEVSIYVAEHLRGQKIGAHLLEALIAESEKEGIWTLQAGIFPENTSSIKIHTALGFREVGYREKIGKMKGVWRDTLLLERRSAIVGTA
jgi:L-amino acid N-acyltransferase YncA